MHVAAKGPRAARPRDRPRSLRGVKKKNSRHATTKKPRGARGAKSRSSQTRPASHAGVAAPTITSGFRRTNSAARARIFVAVMKKFMSVALTTHVISNATACVGLPGSRSAPVSVDQSAKNPTHWRTFCFSDAKRVTPGVEQIRLIKHFRKSDNFALC
jgi:hypothetical protein